MASVAAILNPLNPSEALLFYCSANANLALEHRTLGSSQYNAYVDNGSPKTPGIIQQPGQFAVVTHNQTVTVYGIISVAVNNVNVSLVSVISPIINPIAAYTSPAATTTHTALAAAADAVNDYVYFLQDNTSGNPSIIEYTFDANPQGSGNPIEFCNPRAGTQLAACYNTTAGTRFVFFQNIASDNSDIWFSQIDLQTENRIPQTSGAKDKTPIAAVEKLNTTTNKLCIYLYYIDDDGDLTRMFFDETSNTWTGPTNVTTVSGLANLAAIPSGSGIAVVPSPTGNANHVYVLQGTAYFDVRDPLDKQ